MDEIELQILTSHSLFSLEKKKQLLYLSQIHFYKDVCIKKVPNDYFDHYIPVTPLDTLYTTYYRACNAQVKGDIESVFTLFTKVSQGPEEFFIVREAKEWLKNHATE